MYHRVITHLEGDATPISDVVLGCALINECASKLDLPNAVRDACRRSVVTRFNSISSEVHALAVILDPLVPFNRISALGPLYPQKSLAFCAMHSFEKVCELLRMSDTEQEEARDEFHLIMSNLLPGFGNRGDSSCETYHPVLWWAIDGTSLAPHVVPVAKAVFSLYGSLAGTERSLKSRSIVQSKPRNCLCDENADMQSYVVFNAKQHKRMHAMLSESRIGSLSSAFRFGIESAEGARFVNSLSERVNRVSRQPLVGSSNSGTSSRRY